MYFEGPEIPEVLFKKYAFLPVFLQVKQGFLNMEYSPVSHFFVKNIKYFGKM
jgi:hypothetical protein